MVDGKDKQTIFAMIVYCSEIQDDWAVGHFGWDNNEQTPVSTICLRK